MTVKWHLFCAVSLTLFLSACTWGEPEVVERPVEITTHIPAELRTCPALPEKPVEPYLQSDVGDYLTRLYGVAAACKSDVRTIDRIYTEAGFPR